MTKPTGRPRGRPKTNYYVTLMARVPEALAERAKRYAGRKQQTISLVIRDALELLLEDDRFSPFMSDTKGETAFLSDRKAEEPRPAEPMAQFVYDRNGEADALAVAPPGPAFVSYMKGEGGDPDAPEPAFLSDTKADYDTTKYLLGELCVHGHDWHGSGQSLKRRSNGECRECLRARDRAYKERKRARAPGPG